MLIKVIIIVFVLFALSRVFLRYKRQEISTRTVIIWALFWLLVTASAIWPKTTDIIAAYVGVSRGADLLVYVSVIVLFFVVFKLLVKLDTLEKDITKIIRKFAIDEKDEEMGNTDIK